MKKIAILIDTISNSGGTDRVAAMLANSFFNEKMNVSVSVLKSGEPYYPINKNIEIRYSKKTTRLGKIIEFAFFCKKEVIDVIIVISMGRLSFEAIPILRGVRVKSKIICSDHVAIQSFNKLIINLKRVAYNLSNEVVVLTEHDKEFMCKVLNVRANVSVIRNMSPYSLCLNDYRKRDKVVLAIGRLTEQKNFKDLIEIWNKVSKNGWVLKIIGDGEEKESLIEYIKVEGVENVEIHPPVKDVNKYYSSSKIIALTSKYEGLPMVLIEAKSFGLVSISYDCNTGPREIIDNDGILIPPGNKKEFKIKLQSLMDNEDTINVLSDKSYENSNYYTAKKIISKWLEVMEVN